MDESPLAAELRQERSEAIRRLLGSPMLRAATDPDGFGAVLRHRSWLRDWFEATCGWPLVVDLRGGWARLVKRSGRAEVMRPARRMRGARQPFDRRRYELLCLACAELTHRPVTTIGILADSVVTASVADPQVRRFDSAQHAERRAFIDALERLASWGVIAFSGGDAESFVARDDGNAMIWPDSSLLHQLLASAAAPSSIAAADAAAALKRLRAEPRYGDAPEGLENVDDETRTRWLRHSLARRLLDDPVLYFDELTEPQRAYLANPAGRAWLLARAGEAGFVVEERAEGKLAVDPDALSTDELFPAAQDNVKQAALLLVGWLVPGDGPERRPVEQSIRGAGRAAGRGDARALGVGSTVPGARRPGATGAGGGRAARPLRAGGARRRSRPASAGARALCAGRGGRPPVGAGRAGFAAVTAEANARRPDARPDEALRDATAGDAHHPRRWVPERAGLVNVWRYADEIFAFHRGRLLLRGPNGAGKSMALELLFPFLLDARLQPRRLSSAAQSRGTLYERVMAGASTAQRVGFLWAEFRRPSGGDVEHFTIGVRLRATSGTRELTRDWFTTAQRVGHELQLLDDSRTPLGRDRLREALGTRGELHESADAYRAAVRRTLFPGCTDDQYDAVINALLALRTERLSQHLTPSRLNEILTQSLPPLDEREVAAIAEGFERLDRRRETIEQLEGDLREVEGLAQRQRAYALRVVTGVAAAVRSAESERDAVTRREREARLQIEAVAEEQRRVDGRRERVRNRIAELEAEVTGIQSLDAYREGSRLDDLRRRAEEAAAALSRQQATLERCARARDEADSEWGEVSEQRQTADANEQSAWVQLESAGRELAAGVVLVSLREAEPDAAERDMAAWVRTRRGAVREVELAIGEGERLVAARQDAERRVEDDRAQLDDAIALRERAAAELATEQERFAAELDAWAAGSRFFHDTRLRQALAGAGTPREATALIRDWSDGEGARLASERTGLVGRAEALAAEEETLTDERARLLAGAPLMPERASWRRDRADGAGAPFWRVVDFRDDVSPVERDRIESALLAAGLLDAWVAVDGGVRLAAGEADLVLDAARPPAAGESLVAVLRAWPDADVAPSVVHRLLEQMPLRDSAIETEASAAIGRDGTFRLHSLSGRGPERPAAFIGEAAREQARARRAAELAERIAELTRARMEVDAAIRAADDARAELDHERSRAPDGTAVDNAGAEVQRRDAVAAEAERRLQASEPRLRDAERAVEAARARLALVASTHALPAEREPLRDVEQRLEGLDRTVRAWTNARRRADAAQRELVRGERRRAQAAEDLQAAQRAREQSASAQRDLEAQWQAIRETIGEDYRVVLERLDRAERERRERRDEAERIDDQRPALAARRATLQRTQEEAERERGAAEERRREAQARFVAAVRAELADDAGVDVDAGRLVGPSAILEAARAVAARHSDAVDADPIRLRDQVADRVYESNRRLAGRADLSFEGDDEHGWWLLRASTEGMRKTIRQLRQSLTDELERARSELLVDEQRLFDETLTGSVREHIAARIRLANDVVDGINRQLDGIRTAAADVGVRLRWEVDPEHEELAAVRQARTLLLRDPADLSGGERRDLYTFLRARIDHVRAGEERGAHWEARLLEALDYRRWHRFTLLLAHQDWMGFRPLTSALQARLSTGERSVALHLPMLASIAAHYDGMLPAEGAPTSPRLILLDELFVGVDQANRAQLLGMLVTWDLDAVLTSDHEWCAYASLDGIAIHHVHADGPPTEAVTTSRFVWDGRARREAPLVEGRA